MTEEYPDDYLPFLTLGKDLGQMGDYARRESPANRRAPAPDKAQVHYYLSLVLMMEGQVRLRAADGRVPRCFSAKRPNMRGRHSP